MKSQVSMELEAGWMIMHVHTPLHVHVRVCAAELQASPCCLCINDQQHRACKTRTPHDVCMPCCGPLHFPSWPYLFKKPNKSAAGAPFSFLCFTMSRASSISSQSIELSCVHAIRRGGREGGRERREVSKPSVACEHG